MNNDRIEIQSYTDIENKYRFNEPANRRTNPYTGTSGEMYGINQWQLGQRANSKRSETITGFRNEVIKDLKATTTSITPQTDSTYTLGTPTLSWLSVYSDNYYSGSGALIQVFKNVEADSGSTIVADSLADTLTISSEDKTIDASTDAGTDTVIISAKPTEAFGYFMS